MLAFNADRFPLFVSPFAQTGPTRSRRLGFDQTKAERGYPGPRISSVLLVGTFSVGVALQADRVHFKSMTLAAFQAGIPEWTLGFVPGQNATRAVLADFIPRLEPVK